MVIDLLDALGRLLVPLLITLAALLGVRRLVRPTSPPHQGLRVIARTGLTRSAIVAIVAVGGRRFLLGASDAGVRMLQELDPASAHEVEDAGGMEPVGPPPWSGMIDRLRERTLRAPGGVPDRAVRR